MLFNSWTFWIFFAVVLPLYWACNTKNQNRLLIVASYIFYGSWDWRFLPLILFSTIMDYTLGLLVFEAPTPQRKHRLVTISVIVNLAILGLFKYYGFFSRELAQTAASIGLR